MIFSSPAAERALDGRGDRPVGRLLAQPIGRHELAEQLLRRERAVADQREEIVGRFRRRRPHSAFANGLALQQRLRR